MYATFLFSHLSINEYFGCFHLLIIVDSAAISICHQVFGKLFSILKGQFLGHGVILCLTFEEQPNCSLVVASFYNLPRDIMLTDTCCHLIFKVIIVTLVSMKWYLIMVSICISLMIKDVEHL